MGFVRRLEGVCILLLAVCFLAGANTPSNAQIKVPDRVIKPSVPSPVPGTTIRVDLDRIRESIEAGARSRIPELKRPTTLYIGKFSLSVNAYSNTGSYDAVTKKITGASGTAWIRFACSSISPIPEWLGKRATPLSPDIKRSFQSFEIVDVVIDPTKQISLGDAHLIQPDTKPGQRIELELAVKKEDAQSIVSAKDAVLEALKQAKGDALVRFENVTIEEVPGKADVGRIIKGNAVFPSDPASSSTFSLSIEGFTAVVRALTLTPSDATADINLILPTGIGAPDSCQPPSLPLGTVSITPDCQFYAVKPSEAYGSWIAGDTGLVVSGTGYLADFSSTEGTVDQPASFKGLLVTNGSASGSAKNPKHSNTGYLAADYSFTFAEITKAGFKGQLTSTGAIEFQTVNPLNFTVRANGAIISIVDGKVAGGQLGSGTVTPPTTAVCKDKNPSTPISGTFTLLEIQDDLDLIGEINFGSSDIAWGELTHPGQEVTAWSLKAGTGFLYMPGGPTATFSPDTGSGFMSWSPSTSLSATLTEMEARKISGVAFPGKNIDNLAIYSPDRPSGTANPIGFRYVEGWLRIGHLGVDAVIRGRPHQWNLPEPLGNKTRIGYVGNDPFDSVLGVSQKERGAEFYFASSAAYDSDVDGKVNLRMPCNIQGLEFADMKASSTANLVGGNVVLPSSGVTLDYWKLKLVPTGNPSQAGVISVRTGRILFTAAGISEPVHFTKAFRLTWGEILADGNIGELFFDYNSFGQTFDKLKYSPSHIALSKYVAGATNGYLATCGTVYFNFFGSAFVNIRDARNDANLGAPHYGREVTVPKTGEASCKPTNLTLHGKWDDISGRQLTVLDFPDATMDYNTKTQWGFIGTGSANVGFIHSDPLEATIEIRGEAIDICLKSTDTHDLDLGFWNVLGGIRHLSGCIRITGPTLERMVIGGYLEQSVSSGHGIVEPKAGYVVEVVSSVTPSTCSFYIAGDVLLQCSGTAVDVSGTMFLKHDFSKLSAEGSVTARLDCNSFLAGLEGKGQVTWYVDPTIQYLQGRIAMTITGWSGGAGLEGGIFIGHNCPKAKAWVLQTTTGRFGISQNQLPDILTGVYGYGQVSFGVNWYIFGGGIELYAGLGAFSIVPPGMSTAWSDLAAFGLPYVVGSAGVCVHGEILGGLVSAAGWCNMTMGGPVPITFEGKFGLEGCVLWVLCASIEVTAGLGPGGFYMY
ncbi:MAG: hypothetical protein N3B12_03475 [Armatimonadetes bacterium]|nr:hypothetical protein [Armatimonadota bacterium]